MNVENRELSEKLITSVEDLRKSISQISVYDFNIYTSMELYYKIANRLNEVIKLFNQFGLSVSEELVKQNECLQYLLNDGLIEEVGKKIIELVNNGTMETIINVNLFNSLDTKINNTINQLENYKSRNVVLISIEDYKQYATGNDYSNALNYIINNVVDNTNRFIINFVDGKEYIINSKINKKYVTLKGNSIINGKIEIGLDNFSGMNWYDTFMHCEILGLKFIAQGSYDNCLNNIDYGIVLRNARSVLIKDCYFSNMKFPILLASRDTFLKQHNNRIRVIDCTFFVCGYNLYSTNIDKTITNGNEFMEHGDIEIRGCSCQETKLGNIYVNALDGLTCFDNIFFLERTGHNILVRYSMRLLISGNQLFEAGLNSLKLDNSAWASISNNHIVLGGKTNKEPSIHITGTDPYKNIACNISINGNIIDECYGDGILIEGSDTTNGMQNVVISNNVIYIKTVDTYKPVRLIGYSLGCVVTGNTSNASIDKSIGYSVTANNGTNQGTLYGNSLLTVSKYVNDGETISSLKIPNNTDYLLVFTGSNATISSISIDNAFNGQKLYIISDWVNNTIIPSSKFKTKDGNNLVLGRDEIREFIYIRGAFREV